MVHNTDMDERACDNRCNECSHIKDIYGEKIVGKGLAQIHLRISAPLALAPGI
jgi:hypothetical protein